MASESAPDVQLEIGHVLFIDVVGYSKLLIDDQRELQQQLNQMVRNTAQFRAAEAAGKLVRLPTGDGMALVFFTTPEAPVQCAVEISEALRAHPQLRLRMGINTGPVSGVADINDKSNIAGAGINMAQRVTDLGDAGHILLSKRAAEDLAQYRRWEPLLHDLGEIEVKHGVKISIVNLYTETIGNREVPEKLKQSFRKQSARRRLKRVFIAGAIVAAIAVALLLFRSVGRSLREVRQNDRAASLPIPEKSIAILPFVDLSQARDQEYFCDGISEEILDALAKVEGLRVVARTSSFAFKGRNADVSEIAQKLNVGNVLEGSLRREGNRIRVAVQLVNARDGFHMWSQTFERELQGVFAVQDEITRAVVDALKVKLAVALPAHKKPNTEGYDLY